MNKFNLLNIGDEISVEITEITESDLKGKSKIICNCGLENVTCTLQYNRAVKSQIELLKVGDIVDGWIIRKHAKNKFISVGTSDFGRIPPRDEIIDKYISVVKYTSNYLGELDKNKYVEPIFDALSEVKGLFNRSVKKDQWDWLFIYKSFGFIDDLQAKKTRDNYVGLLNKLKNVRKEKISSNVVLREKEIIEKVRDKLLVCLSYLMRQKSSWEIIKKPIPKNEIILNTQKTIVQHSSVDEDPSEYIQIFKSKIKLERANSVHQLLVDKMTESLASIGIQAFYNGLIDLYCIYNNEFYIFEMKSITESNERSQIRKAISQLYEYRYIHEKSEAKLIIVLEKKPEINWLIDYLTTDRQIHLTWFEEDQFVTPRGDEFILSINNSL